MIRSDDVRREKNEALRVRNPTVSRIAPASTSTPCSARGRPTLLGLTGIRLGTHQRARVDLESLTEISPAGVVA